MSTSKPATVGTDPLTELVDLLTSNDLEPEVLASHVEAIRNARTNPELDWMDADAADHAWVEVAILFALIDHVATSDKVDELHDLISDCFADPLAPYPHPADKMDFLPPAYFRWLDHQLAARSTGYELVLLDSGLDDNVNAFVVNRRDTDRIVALAKRLMLRIDRATSVYVAAT